ncbi:response regulator [Aliidiomarina indica]|uniref:response regulator n=1 Tax=Aliidiomarina indica TaxID=2749147 RepID=UPI0018901E75|nr:response regulator transcription factor [Aliidiomarina indica]
MNEPLKVFLVDDQWLVRRGIVELLEMTGSVEVLGEAEDGQLALEWLAGAEVLPEVLLVDIRMPRMSGVELVQAVGHSYPQIACLVLTTFDDYRLVLECMQAGARGYLLKDVPIETLVVAIKQVAEGKVWLQPGVTDSLLRAFNPKQDVDSAYKSVPNLTERETQILHLIAAGMSNKEIADATFRSEGTIKNQVSTLIAKLGTRDRTQAVLKAIEWGLIERKGS